MSRGSPKELQTSFVALRAQDVHELENISGATLLVIMPFINRALAERSARQLAGRAGTDGLLVAIEDIDRQGFITVLNQAFRTIPCEFVAYVAQDAFAGRQWLLRADHALQKTGKAVLAFNDGKWRGAMAAFGFVRRSWAEANYGGLLFHPAYKQHYADVELSMLAIHDKQYCYDPDAVLVEVDWDKDRAPVNAGDRLLYRQRAAQGLDGRVIDADLLKRFS